MTKRTLLAFALIALVPGANAQDESEQNAFVEANILSIFYHELGHAVIDLMNVPIFGQEEDAADVMAVLLIHDLFEESTAQSIAYDSAFGYINDPDQTEEVQYWDLHGPDEQRFYNHVCLFYGGNVEARESLANDLGLPEERAEYCAEEFEQAYGSWGVIFDEMADENPKQPITLSEGSGENTQLLNELLAIEIANINADFTLPQELVVNVISCDEANAFYDPEAVSISFCTEFIPHLEILYQKNL